MILTADGQALTVDMVADGSSSLAIALQNGSSLTGSIDAARISGTSIANTLGNGHTVTCDASAAANSGLGGKTYSLANGGQMKPA